MEPPNGLELWAAAATALIAGVLRLAGWVLGLTFFAAIYVRPEFARGAVWLVSLRYPRAKVVLETQLEEVLEEPGRLRRRADVLDGLAGIVAQARYLSSAEKNSETRTAPSSTPEPFGVGYYIEASRPNGEAATFVETSQTLHMLADDGSFIRVDELGDVEVITVERSTPWDR